MTENFQGSKLPEEPDWSRGFPSKPGRYYFEFPGMATKILRVTQVEIDGYDPAEDPEQRLRWKSAD